MAKKVKQEKKAAEPEVESPDQEEVAETPKKRKQTEKAETKSSGKADKASSKTAKTDEKPAAKKAETTKADKKVEAKADKKGEKKTDKKEEKKATDKKADKKTETKADAKSSKKSKKEPEPEPEEESSADEEQEDQDMEEANEDGEEQEESEKPTKKAKTDAGADDDNAPGEVFLSNVSDSVEDSDIQELFEGLGVSNIKWLTNREGAFSGKGFVKLSSSGVGKALQLNGTEVKGQELSITLPRNASSAGASGASSGETTTVFVGNLPFSIDDEGIREHFKECGEIKEVRWGMRDGEFKGYGHLEFDSAESATKALELAGSELGGREIRVDASLPRFGSSSGSRGGPFGGGRGGPARGRGGRGGFGGRGNSSAGRGNGRGRGRGGFGGGRGGAQSSGKRTTF